MSDNQKPEDPDTTRAVQAVCAIHASAFAGVGAKVMFEGDYMRGPIGIALGLFFAVASVSVHWWKDRVSRRSFNWFTQTADRALPLVLGFAFLYVIGVLAPRTQSTTT